MLPKAVYVLYRTAWAKPWGWSGGHGEAKVSSAIQDKCKREQSILVSKQRFNAHGAQYIVTDCSVGEAGEPAVSSDLCNATRNQSIMQDASSVVHCPRDRHGCWQSGIAADKTLLIQLS
jgi:hypothetical protein